MAKAAHALARPRPRVKPAAQQKPSEPQMLTRRPAGQRLRPGWRASALTSPRGWL
ncbi:hypothetical protein RR42_m4081 [Cupriavidus basilensis]|uniref:Uncharacterized protein n=1 Tax=Cupriavidus basilensis TaxID=68895 RepID=A0A0C4YHN4_9BURK|nr:hypothetical protein RR42_m4081 [Cupriavidus basilensis]